MLSDMQSDDESAESVLLRSDLSLSDRKSIESSAADGSAGLSATAAAGDQNAPAEAKEQLVNAAEGTGSSPAAEPPPADMPAPSGSPSQVGQLPGAPGIWEAGLLEISSEAQENTGLERPDSPVSEDLRLSSSSDLGADSPLV